MERDDASGSIQSTTKDLPDETADALWLQFLSGDDVNSLHAFDQLYAVLHAPVFRYCRSILRNEDAAHEMTQRVFVRLLENKPRTQVSVIGMTLRIARNLCIDERRRDRRVKLDGKNELQATSIEFTSESEEHEDRKALEECLDQLSEKSRAVVVLHDGEGLTFKHIRDALGLGVAFSTLTRWLRAARDTLLRCLKEKGIF